MADCCRHLLPPPQFKLGSEEKENVFQIHGTCERMATEILHHQNFAICGIMSDCAKNRKQKY